MANQLGQHCSTTTSERVEGCLQVARIPQNDGGDQQVQPRCPISLVLERAVAQLAQAVKEHGAGERVGRLALIQPGIGDAWESLQPCTLSGLARVVRHEGELAIER